VSDITVPGAILPLPYIDVVHPPARPRAEAPRKSHREKRIMAYVITDSCLKDVLCADACPTDCIHPKKDEPKFETATQMYVDPEGCIDCGACVAVCPSNSMFPAEEVPDDKKGFVEKNAQFYAN
jgi:ferredoxin